MKAPLTHADPANPQALSRSTQWTDQRVARRPDRRIRRRREYPPGVRNVTPSDTPGARISVSRRQGETAEPPSHAAPPIVGIPHRHRPGPGPLPGARHFRFPRCPASPNPSHGRPIYLRVSQFPEAGRVLPSQVREATPPSSAEMSQNSQATLHFWARQGELSRRGGRRRVRRGGARAGGGGRARRRRRGRRRGRCASGGRVAWRRHSIRSETGGPRAWPARQRASCTTPRAGERGPRRRVGRTGRAGAWRQTASAWRQTASCARRPTFHCRCIRGRPSSPGLG